MKEKLQAGIAKIEGACREVYDSLEAEAAGEAPQARWAQKIRRGLIIQQVNRGDDCPPQPTASINRMRAYLAEVAEVEKAAADAASG